MEMSSMTMASMTHSHMPSATSSKSGMDMDHSMDMNHGMMMGMQDMMMTFFTATNTPLYSSTWMPSTTAQYFGTCLFLIVLAFVFRALIAIRFNFLPLLARATAQRDTNILRPDAVEKDGANVMVLQRRPWRINEAVLRACLDTTLAGVSYLLMLAVMTMNVGYFMSVLGGTFLGSFVVGGFTGPAVH